MRTIHINPRFGGAVELYEFSDTPDGEPLGAELIGSAMPFQSGFTHTKAEGRIFETQGKALVDLAITAYGGIPDFVLAAMPDILGADAFAEAVEKIRAAAFLHGNSGSSD